MKILVAGNGKVGETLTKELADEGHDLILIDRDAAVLEATAYIYVTLFGVFLFHERLNRKKILARQPPDSKIFRVSLNRKRLT